MTSRLALLALLAGCNSTPSAADEAAAAAKREADRQAVVAAWQREAAARPPADALVLTAADERHAEAQAAQEARMQAQDQAAHEKAETSDRDRAVEMAASNDVAGMRRMYLEKLSRGQKFTLTVGGDGTAVTVQAELCDDAVLGIFNTDLGVKLKKFGFTWLVCADQSARQEL